MLRNSHTHFMMAYTACVVLVLRMWKILFKKVYSGYVTKSTHSADIK